MNFISVCRADEADIDTADKYIIQPNCGQEAMVSYSETVEEKRAQMQFNNLDQKCNCDSFDVTLNAVVRVTPRALPNQLKYQTGSNH